MNASDKRQLEREALRSVIQQWNANRVDLFELSEPNEDLEFHGVMRFYFQDSGQKVATKCIRVASDATVADVIEILIEKFRPDMRMLSLPSYALFEVHSNHEERKLSPSEKPLLVQLNWHIDDREGRFLLRNVDHKTNAPMVDFNEVNNFKRKLSKREKKELKKKEKLCRLQSDLSKENKSAEKLYTELPETSFTRSISNPEAVMRRRRQQKLERKLQQFRSKDGGPDTGGTLKIYGESLCRDVPYKTLLLSVRDCAQAVVREMLTKYGLEKADPAHHCLVQVNGDGSEYILDDDECPLAILMNQQNNRGSIMFHVRRRPADAQPRRRKKKPLSGPGSTSGPGVDWNEGPVLMEIGPNGQQIEGGRRIRVSGEPIEVGSASSTGVQLFGPMIQPKHCVIAIQDNECVVTPLHADAPTFVNGHRIYQATILHHGSVVMFGRVASFKYSDPQQSGRLSRHLAISQSHLDNTSVYDRSPTSPIPNDRALSSPLDNMEDLNMETVNSHKFPHDMTDYTIKHDNENVMLLNKPYTGIKNIQDSANPRHDNFETTFDLDGNVETKSVGSAKSAGSNQEIRTNSLKTGQELILPAVLEFPEPTQDIFLRHVISELDVNIPTFKLAPVYTLYLCARYRASTHYRPELQPTERAHKLTVLLHHVASIIQGVIKDHQKDAKFLSFWMANSSEFLHFLKCDRHISAFSIQAQDVLAESVQYAFRYLVSCFYMDLSETLGQFLSENIDHDSAAGLVLSVLGSVMALLRRCRVNAALTIQLFSQLFYYINVRCFNKVVTSPHMCSSLWGQRIQLRLLQLQQWAERQGLELAADCHLAKIVQCTHLLQAPKNIPEDIVAINKTCFKLNSLQISALLRQCSDNVAPPLIEIAVRNAESIADELIRGDGREVKLEEGSELPLALLLPDDGFSCDVVKGVPHGLVDFLQPLQSAGLCRLAVQPTSIGHWTVYMQHYHGTSSASINKACHPEVQIIKLHKNSNGMGLSIVAAKGAGQDKLGIYIKSVVAGGAADLDQRLQAGDQLLSVDGQSLIGITQEKAAEFLMHTGSVVTLEVAKQGAIYHGLATLLQQPSPLLNQGPRRLSERDLPSRLGAEGSNKNVLPSSKSVPALHHVGFSTQEISSQPSSMKSHSTHNLTHNSMAHAPQQQEQSFYQNLGAYRGNLSQPNLGDRGSLLRSSQNLLQQNTLPSSGNTRPASAYFANQPQVGPGLSNSQRGLAKMAEMSEEVLRRQYRSPNPGLLSPNRTRLPFDSDSQLYQNNISASPVKQSPNVAPKPQMKRIIGQEDGPLSPPIPPTSTHPLYRGNSSQNMGHQQAFNMSQPNIQYNYMHQQNQMPINNQTMYSGNKQQNISNQHPIHSNHQQLIDYGNQFNTQFSNNTNAGYTASMADPPRVNFYPMNTQGSQSKPGFGANNPWEREEKEKELEARREQTRQWRDKQIAELSSYMTRTPQQEEQLRALKLEREFQRRAQEAQHEEDSEQDKETTERTQGILKPSHQSNSSNHKVESVLPQSSIPTNIISNTTPISSALIKQHEESSDILPNVNKSYNSGDDNLNTSSLRENHTPKSILKQNMRPDNLNISSPLTKQNKNTHFAESVVPQNLSIDTTSNSNTALQSSVTKLSKNLAGMSFNKSADNMDIVSNQHNSSADFNMQREYNQYKNEQSNDFLMSPPPPPERKSSFQVMNQQAALRNGRNSVDIMSCLPDNSYLTPSQAISNSTQNITSQQQSLHDKRVSFNENEDNSFIINDSSQDLGVIREDPDKFITEAEGFLQSPQSPETNVNCTPGVIGAQEIYRDPRQKRLLEQQRQAQTNSTPIPEKLSFKEKMKMFALESGESQTPRDKLKISRAQRDIDAVH